MSTARSTVPANSSRPTSSAPSRCCRRRCATGARSHPRSASSSVSSTSPPTKCSARSVTTAFSRKPRLTRRTRPTPQARLPPTAWRETYELPTLVTNCSNNYGPYHFPEKLIPHMIIKGLAGEPLPVYGDGKNIRHWLYVEDHAKALTLVLEQGKVGETYNVGGRNERTNLYVVETICDLL